MYRTIFFQYLIILLFFLSCNQTTENATIIPPENYNMINVGWELISAKLANDSLNLNEYEPFRFVFTENYIWATDNCNYLEGNYLFVNDSLLTSDIGITEKACFPYNLYIPFSYLYRGNKLYFDKDKLYLSFNNSEFTYYSRFIKDLPQHKFLDDTLTLLSSNDSNFVFYDSLNSYPQIVFSSDRTFYTKWTNNTTWPTFSRYKYAGIYGMNINDEIKFTNFGFQFDGNEVPNFDFGLVPNILLTNRYNLNVTKLELFNDKKNTFYEFGYY